MKNLKLLIATLLSLQFASPAYSNNSDASELQLKEYVYRTQLKTKSDQLQDLLKKQWVIENMNSNSADNFYISYHDNPVLLSAIGIISLSGFIKLVELGRADNFDKNAKFFQTLKNEFKSKPAPVGVIVVFLSAAAAYMANLTVHFTSDVAKLRKQYETHAKNGTLVDHYNTLRKDINLISQEIVELNKQLAN